MKHHKAKPFLKWVGGKTQLLKQYYNYYPSGLREQKIKKYVEPFLGGGAMFFDINNKFVIDTAYLSDLNRDLVLTYKVIQQKPNILLEHLYNYQTLYDSTPQDKRQALFLRVRTAFNEQRFTINYQTLQDDWIVRASYLIFLNKTCFNGLYRLNRKAGFNVPYGKYKKALICDVDNIQAVSEVLQKAQINYADYSACFNVIDENTFVYFDPPYRPLSKTASFTTYTGITFKDKEQLALASFFRQLDKAKKPKLMLSNADPKNADVNDTFFEEAYAGYNIFRVSAGRSINCKGNKRGKISELLITNY